MTHKKLRSKEKARTKQRDKRIDNNERTDEKKLVLHMISIFEQ